MAKRFFVCTYNDQEAFDISKQHGLLGFSTKNAGTIGNIKKLEPGDFILVRDSRNSNGLKFFGLFEVQDRMYRANSSSLQIWSEEISANQVIFVYRVPVKFIKSITKFIPKSEIVNWGWKRRYKPFNKYSWTGYSRLFAGNFLDNEQAAKIASILDLNNGLDLTPKAFDIEPDILEDSPGKKLTEIYRILRDTTLARQVKSIHNYVCQICGQGPIKLPNGDPYAEAHHLKPLGKHAGPDIKTNIICVCPNCHVKLDYGVIEINVKKLQDIPDHTVGKEFILYHNSNLSKVNEPKLITGSVHKSIPFCCRSASWTVVPWNGTALNHARELCEYGSDGSAGPRGGAGWQSGGVVCAAV